LHSNKEIKYLANNITITQVVGQCDMQ
jgi:hypothetical protein